jgi:hypothetical protein
MATFTFGHTKDFSLFDDFFQIIHMEMFGSFIFIFIFLRLTLSQVTQKTLKNKYLSLSLLYMNKNSCLSLSLFPSSTQLFFFVWVRRLYSPEMVFDASPVYV